MSGSPTPPPWAMLYWLALHAARTPNRIALQIGSSLAVDYARFHADSLRFCQALAILGVRPGWVVAVEHPHFYIHWLLLTACEALGAVSTFAERNTGLSTRVDLVLSPNPSPTWAGARCQIIDSSWLEHVSSQPAVFDQYCSSSSTGSSPACTIWTSGTTGTPKGMTLDRAALDWRIEHVAQVSAFRADTTFLASYSITLHPVWIRAIACIRRGAKVMVTTSGPECWSAGNGVLWCLPALLGVLLSEPPATTAGRLRIITGGGPISESLRQAVIGLPETEIRAGYGTNEAGSAICLMDEAGLGTPQPGVEVDIVNEDGTSCPDHVDGIIALRTPGMVHGYVNDAEASTASFRDGWFLSGDMGRRQPDGRFLLLGRRDDMLNLGGIKFPSSVIEDQIREKLGTSLDLAALSLPDHQGIGRLHLVFEAPAHYDMSGIMEQIHGIIPAWFMPCTIQTLNSLPRTQNGKIRRAELRRLLSLQAR